MDSCDIQGAQGSGFGVLSPVLDDCFTDWAIVGPFTFHVVYPDISH